MIKKFYLLLKKHNFVVPLTAFFSSRLWLLLTGWWSQYFPTSRDYPIAAAIERGWVTTPQRWLDIWSRWDSGWYLQIAKTGYWPVGEAYSTQVESSWPFFPLYPTLIRVIHQILPLPNTETSYLIIATILSQLFFFFSLVVLYHLLKTIWSDQVAKTTTWLTVVFPTAFFFSVAYTESLFFLLTLLTLLFGWNKEWLKASIFGSLAVLTRSSGIFLLIPLGLWWWQEEISFPIKWLRFIKILWLGLLPLALISFAGYAWLKTGNPLASIQSQVAWQRGFSWPWHTWFGQTGWIGFITPLDKWLGVIAASIMIWQIRTDKNSKIRVLWMYGFLAFIYPLFTGSLASISRYYLSVIPLIMAQGVFFSRHRFLKKPFFYLYLTAQVFYFTSWTQLYWAG